MTSQATPSSAASLASIVGREDQAADSSLWLVVAGWLLWPLAGLCGVAILVAGGLAIVSHMRRASRMSAEETESVKQLVGGLRNSREYGSRIVNESSPYYHALLDQLSALGPQGPQTEILLYSMNIISQFIGRGFETQEKVGDDTRALVEGLLRQVEQNQNKSMQKQDRIISLLARLTEDVEMTKARVGTQTVALEKERNDDAVRTVGTMLTPAELCQEGGRSALDRLRQARQLVDPAKLRFYWYMGKRPEVQGAYEFWHILNDDDLLRYLRRHERSAQPLLFARWWSGRPVTHREGNLEVYPAPAMMDVFETLEKRECLQQIFTIKGSGKDVKDIDPAGFDISEQPVTADGNHHIFLATLRRKGEITLTQAHQPSAHTASRKPDAPAHGPLDLQSVLADYNTYVRSDPTDTKSAAVFVGKYQPKPGARGTVTGQEGTIPQPGVQLGDPSDRTQPLWVIDLRNGQALAALSPDAYRPGGGDAWGSTLRYSLGGIFTFQGEGQTIAAMSKPALLTSVSNSDAATVFRIREQGVIELK